jgi:membrane fusion protein (multidrug efflux system)
MNEIDGHGLGWIPVRPDPGKLNERQNYDERHRADQAARVVVVDASRLNQLIYRRKPPLRHNKLTSPRKRQNSRGLPVVPGSLLAGLLATVVLAGCTKKPDATAAKPEVQTITVAPKDVPIYQKWIGTLDGYPNAQIRAQVSGYLIKQDYVEGSAVKKGDLFFEVDPRPFQAMLDQAQGKLAQDQAQYGKTQLDVKRFTPLAREQAVSQQELDDAIQADLVAGAAIQSDKAAVESATLNLEFCKITSPVDGIAGTAQAQIGDLVGPGGTVLTTVSTIDPVRAYFNISEQSYLAFFRQFTNAEERGANLSEMELQLILSDGSTYPLPGKWFFVNRQVDINTGTLQVAALFPNPDYILRPGQYALVRAKTETRHGAILLPQRAVTELQGSYQVAIVDAENKVHIKTVQVGDQVGNDWLIEKGLEANDRVVAEGTQKVKDGMVVDPRPYGSPMTNSAAPLAKE